MAREILSTPDAERIYSTKIKNATATEYEKYIAALLPHVSPMHLLDEYRTARYGRASKNPVTPSLQSVIPSSYIDSYNLKSYARKPIDADRKNQIMKSDQRELLKQEIMSNDAAARAARAVPGMMKRNARNEPMLSRNITREQFE